MLNEAFQLSFFGKLGLTLPNLGENPASMVIWRRKFEKNLKKDLKKKKKKCEIFLFFIFLLVI